MWTRACDSCVLCPQEMLQDKGLSESEERPSGPREPRSAVAPPAPSTLPTPGAGAVCARPQRAALASPGPRRRRRRRHRRRRAGKGPAGRLVKVRRRSVCRAASVCPARLSAGRTAALPGQTPSLPFVLPPLRSRGCSGTGDRGTPQCSEPGKGSGAPRPGEDERRKPSGPGGESGPWSGSCGESVQLRGRGTDVTVTLCTPSACAGLQAAPASAALSVWGRGASQVGVSARKSVAVLGRVFMFV